MSSFRAAVVAAVVIGHAIFGMAQQGGWDDGQVNATMCYWEQLRASVVRDTAYLDGGTLWWLPGMSDGGYGAITNDDNPLGIVYTLNFSTAFNMSQNISAVMGTLSKAPNGGAANNIAPNYVDGAMLANNDEWFLYGGLLRQTKQYSDPAADAGTAYEAYQYGVNKPNFRPGFLNYQLPEGLTRYIAYGGAANAPSENKAFYFSGLRAPSWGPIYVPSINESLTAVNVSDTFITLDMDTQQQESWKNATLPDFIKGRANPELVWVPVGSQGILVALGGVVYPDFVNVTGQSANEAASKNESPKFMSTIDIYDIANDKWFQQPTVGGPSQLTRGCAVVAPAQDMSSFNIYYYGGYNGLDQTDEDAFNDDVWILSLPSFMWMKVASGTKEHARAGHKCVMPYPDQMMVIGGSGAKPGGSPTCVGDGIVQLFNLTTGKWLDRYDPNVWAPYGIPEMIYVMIGGTATGGATMTTPSPTGWATPALSEVFATPYPTSKLTSYYPYNATGSGNGTRPDVTKKGGSGVPSYLPPLLGVILGLIFISSVVVAILLWRRRKLLRRNGGASEAGTDDNGNRILSWIRGQPTEKAPTVTTSEDSTLSPDMEHAILQPANIVHHEMPDTQLAELPDTSPRAELQDTGLTPVEIITKHSHLGQNSSLNNPSSYSGTSQIDHASSVSRSSGTRPAGPPSDLLRPDSPPLGMTYETYEPVIPAASTARPLTPRGESGVSGLSERDRAHLRQISDPTTVSSMDTAGTSRPVENAIPEENMTLGTNPGSTPGSNAGSPGPVSPPSSEYREAEDYLNARRPTPGQLSPRTANQDSPLRRSVFYESRDDLGHAR